LEKTPVAEEQIIRLLEGIRDLQKHHVENCKDALKNRQQSIEIQRQAMRRQGISFLVIGLVLLLFLGYIAWSSHPTK
jgi:hypothetical protein